MAESLEEIPDIDLVEEVANRMKMEGEERGRFVHLVMLRCGYEPVPTYVARDKKPREEDKPEREDEPGKETRRSGFYKNYESE